MLAASSRRPVPAGHETGYDATGKSANAGCAGGATFRAWPG